VWSNESGSWRKRKLFLLNMCHASCPGLSCWAS
jgi:hypothetical protein